MESDGGYYAIKGFDFQVDKAILDLFKSNDGNEKIYIECIQDLNTDKLVTQVKYKETQDFSNIKIREPVVQLIEESHSDKSDRKYILYCHFNDKAAGEHSFSEDEIKDILSISRSEKDPSLSHIKKIDRIDKITDSMIESFSKRFKLVFAEKYSTHFSVVIEAIAKQAFCSNKTEAIFFYGFIADYLRKLVITNSDTSNRFCSKNDLIEAINTGKRRIFYSSLLNFESRSTYLKFIKKRFLKFLPSQPIYVFIGDINETESITIGDLISTITKKHFNKATYNVFPITFIVSDSVVFNVKKYLIKNDIVFNDGYESINFSESMFNRERIFTRTERGGRATESLKSISYKVRIISNNSFNSIKNHSTPPMKVYYFGCNELPIFSDIQLFKVEDINTNELLDLFN